MIKICEFIQNILPIITARYYCVLQYFRSFSGEKNAKKEYSDSSSGLIKILLNALLFKKEKENNNKKQINKKKK